MLEKNCNLSIRKQSDILGINRSSVYNKRRAKVMDKIEEKIQKTTTGALRSKTGPEAAPLFFFLLLLTTLLYSHSSL